MMTEKQLTIETREQKHQPVLSIRMNTKAENLPVVIGESYAKIARYLEELDVEPAGPPFVAYYNLDMENLDVEMGFPVDDVVPGDHDMCPGEIVEGKVVSCMYEGPYEGMAAVYEKMNEYIRDKGFTATGVAYETYYNSPDDVRSHDELLTRIDLPVHG